MTSSYLPLANGYHDADCASQREMGSGRTIVEQAHDWTQAGLWRLALVMHCHQRPERSFFYNGRQVPLCARCLGLLLGTALVPLYCTDLRLASALMLAMILDGLTQALALRESRNWLRLASGIGFALGGGGLLIRACHHIWNT